MIARRSQRAEQRSRLTFRFAAAIVAAAWWAGSASATERGDQLIASFRGFCNLNALRFSQIDEMATAMRLPSRNEEISGGELDQSKSWLVFLSSGPHELMASEVDGPSGKLTTCGIRAPDINGEEFLLALMRSLRLGDPMSARKSPGGQNRITTWKIDASSYDILLVLTDNTVAQKPGISLVLLHRATVKS